MSTTKIVLIAIPFAILGFLLGANAPLGQMIWPADTSHGEPAGAAFVALVAYGVFEALAFGVGIAFLAFGWPALKRATPEAKGLAMATYAAIGWLLVSWVPHDNLHQHVGTNFAALAALEWGFHATLMVAGGILALFFLKAMGRQAGSATP